jgi:hypothetical protein
MTFEVFDVVVTADTVGEHLKKRIQPILQTFLKKGQTWPLKRTTVDSKGNERTLSGGWFYQIAYTHKEVNMDWGLARRAGVDKMGAALLGVHNLDEIWPECVALYSKVSSEGGGESGKKAYKVLAALVQGRTHATMEIITKTNAPMLILKVCVPKPCSRLQSHLGPIPPFTPCPFFIHTLIPSTHLVSLSMLSSHSRLVVFVFTPRPRIHTLPIKVQRGARHPVPAA